MERSFVAAGAKIAAAENDAKVWDETRRECDLAVRAKGAAVATAKEEVEKAARVVVCNLETASRLVNDLAQMQDEIVERRSVLRFISRHGCNGELPRDLASRIESLLLQDLSGFYPTDI